MLFRELIEYFENAGDTAAKCQSQVYPLEGLSAAERIHWKILHRVKDGVETDMDELLSEFIRQRSSLTGQSKF